MEPLTPPLGRGRRGLATGVLMAGLIVALLSGFGVFSAAVGTAPSVVSVAAGVVPLYLGARRLGGGVPGASRTTPVLPLVAGVVGLVAAGVAAVLFAVVARDQIAAVALGIAAVVHVVALLLGRRLLRS